MIRTQIQLTPEQHRGLRELAHQKRLSLAELLRRWIDEKLDEETSVNSREARIRAALAVCGKYEDRASADDVASEHDRHLAEAYLP